jgi:hypothetical protein
MSMFMHRIHTHGWLRGLRYSLGVVLLYPLLNGRHKARTEAYKDSRDGKEMLLSAIEVGGERRYTGTLAHMLGVESLSLETLERLNAWNAEHTREGFRRGAMMESLHIVRCDPPEDFYGPYEPVERS